LFISKRFFAVTERVLQQGKRFLFVCILVRNGWIFLMCLPYPFPFQLKKFVYYFK